MHGTSMQRQWLLQSSQYSQNLGCHSLSAQTQTNTINLQGQSIKVIDGSTGVLPAYPPGNFLMVNSIQNPQRQLPSAFLLPNGQLVPVVTNLANVCLQTSTPQMLYTGTIKQNTEPVDLSHPDLENQYGHDTLKAPIDIKEIRRDYYRITLMVSSEQEGAIINLYKDRQWSYLKLDNESDSTPRCNFENKAVVSNGQDRFLENGVSEQQDLPVSDKTLHDAIDDQVSYDEMVTNTSIGYSSNKNSNSHIQNEIYSTTFEKQMLCVEENSIVERTNDLIQCRSTEGAKYICSQADTWNENTVKNISLESEMPPSITNQSHVCGNDIVKSGPLSTYKIKCEQERHLKSLSISDKEESQADITDVLITDETESKGLDNVDIDGNSKEKDEDQTQNKDVSRGQRKAPKITNNIYCKGCEHTFKKSGCYEKHLKEDRCKHVCEFCGKAFLYNSTWRYEIHIKYHKKQRGEECKICGKLFIERSKMRQHVKSHAVPKPMICEKCGLTFPNITSLRLHMANIHVENKEKVQCCKCAKMYSTKHNLEYHIRSAHASGCLDTFSCSTCNKTFKHKKLLIIHERTHSEKRDFKCDKCSAAFKLACTLSEHKKRHEKAYKFFCEMCNKGFYEKGKLKEHENMHTGTKPFQCSICDYRCASASNLPKHMKIHRGTDNNKKMP